MQLKIADAIALAKHTLVKHRMPADCAQLVAEHLVDTELCGNELDGLPRLLAIVDQIGRRPLPEPMRVVRETANSAHIDGGDNIGYAVSIFAVDKGIEICRRTGLAVVTANNTWLSGRLAYVVERAAREGFVIMHACNTTARVTPFGGIDRVLGTNPFAMAFPSTGDPVVIDIGTSLTAWGDVVMARAKGEALPDGVAVDSEGSPTRDPDAALAGAFLGWGGQRGGALSVAIQLLGVLAGSRPIIDNLADFGLFFLLLDPKTLSGDDFPEQVDHFKSLLHSSRPASGMPGVRLPGEGSLEKRRRNLEAGFINFDDQMYARIVELGA